MFSFVLFFVIIFAISYETVSEKGYWTIRVSLSVGRHYICYVFSRWLRPCSAIDRKRALNYLDYSEGNQEIRSNSCVHVTVCQTTALLDPTEEIFWARSVNMPVNRIFKGLKNNYFTKHNFPVIIQFDAIIVLVSSKLELWAVFRIVELSGILLII